MRSIALTLATALALLPMTAAADPSFECSISNGSQVEIGNCVAEAEAVVDKTVELTLGFAMNAAQELDEITGRDVAVPALEQGQAAWSAYRDAHCEYVGSTFGGGSGTSIAIHACRVELGRARVSELMKYAQ
ncbi:lysozyme inhibitor LprI family protein [Ostreiculturibacter nitratireducens]|uniref:lysozyme inhibitor LprI family protein n=1 Tax=Ostreiculturibacter nitratireducens TaxID=3075226 RepID=UPI0031B59046